MLQITQNISISDEEIELSAIRAQGSGGQNVNKVSSAIHLRFDINTSSLPSIYRERLLALKDSRINKDGVIIIKAQQILRNNFDEPKLSYILVYNRFVTDKIYTTQKLRFI